jgi:branched-chain amino acid transport system ATP-binding protein
MMMTQTSDALAVAAQPPREDHLLHCKGVTAEYGRIRVLHGIDLELRAGEVLAVLGANGAGKSSLLGAISGSVKSAGSTELAGQAIGGLPPHRRATMGLAFVPEARRNMFRVLSTAENLDIGLQLIPAAQRSETLAFICDLFPILESRREVPAGMLSGGEQQMLAIGIALGRRPRALLLDEPTQGLAPAVFDILERAMERLRETGVAILLAEQNLHFAARVAERYVVLLHGKIVASGNAEGMRDEARMSALYFDRHDNN